MALTIHSLPGPPPKLFTSPRAGAAPCTLSYLDEGGANFVFTLRSADHTALPPYLHARLLRLRKDLAHIPSAADQLTAFNSHLKHLFPPDNLVQHELVALDPSFAAALDAALPTLARPAHRHHYSLPRAEAFGLLITDMTPRHPAELLIQVKPKWLCQSPTAPASSTRCRTCALRAYRAAQSIRTATDKQGSCPLDLVDERLENRRRAATRLTQDEPCLAFLVHGAQGLLPTLRTQQLLLDSQGVLAATAAKAKQVHDLCRAMTLRDCTLFIRRSGAHIEARLGDLDMKSPEKLPRWQEVERVLIEGGWYTNSEAQEHWTRESVCLLSR